MGIISINYLLSIIVNVPKRIGNVMWVIREMKTAPVSERKNKNLLYLSARAIERLRAMPVWEAFSIRI
jgi:hypothetical protein